MCNTTKAYTICATLDSQIQNSFESDLYSELLSTEYWNRREWQAIGAVKVRSGKRFGFFIEYLFYKLFQNCHHAVLHFV
jgi:hypothetical protein